MSPSILNDTKKYLGIAENYTAFDADIMMQINSALTNLNQLGIGPVLGVTVNDATTQWSVLAGDDLRLLGGIQNYVYLKTRLGFDPPQTSHHLVAIKEQITELEWRLEHGRGAPIVSTEGMVLDGGGA